MSTRQDLQHKLFLKKKSFFLIFFFIPLTLNSPNCIDFRNSDGNSHSNTLLRIMCACTLVIVDIDWRSVKPSAVRRALTRRKRKIQHSIGYSMASKITSRHDTCMCRGMVYRDAVPLCAGLEAMAGDFPCLSLSLSVLKFPRSSKQGSPSCKHHYLHAKTQTGHEYTIRAPRSTWRRMTSGDATCP